MLEGGKTILRMGQFELRIRHLLVIGVLAIAFTTAFIIRSYPSKYGFYLNEFDPYFDYRATKYIVDHGLNAYFSWHDTMSWYPEGRDVPATSQSGLHIVAASLYKIFGAGTSLLDFTILLPVVLGSLTTIVVFALVRTLGGTSAGMFSALLFAFSPAIIQRGNLGWFKSEPLGLFFGLLGVYLLLSAIKHKEIKYSILKAIAGGFVLGLANASWGGVQYFSIPISIFFIALPFFRKDTTIPVFVAIAFTVVTILTAGGFPRPGISFVFGLAGLALMGGTTFLIIAHFVKKLSEPRKAIRNTLFLLIAFFALGVGIIAVGAYHHSSFRYLNALNPFLSTQNQLVASVAEHFTPTLVDYFTNYSVLLMFAGLGAWIAFKRRNDMSIFALLLGITGVYVSATFARLLVFASIGIIVLAGLGLYEITRTYLDRESSSSSAISSSFVATSKSKKVKKKNVEGSKVLPVKSRWMILSYVVLIIAMLCIPMVYPPNSNWLSSADIPPSIANGGTGYRLQTNDWIDTLNWIAKDTPKNSVIAAWWDYGYWITTLGNKTSLADNATINQTRIATIAKMFIDQKENGIKVAQDLKADYILVYVVGQRFSGVNGTAFYTLGSGGDESKKQWFMRIGGFDETNYLQADGFTATPRFWNTTLLGQIIPFTPQAYASFQGGQLTNLQPKYAPGTIALYVKHIKFPVGSNPDNQPLSLVYSSPSFQSNDPGLVFGVLVYKVNHNYVPKITSNPYHEVFVNVTQQPSQQQLKPLQPFSPSSSHPIRSSIPSSGQGTPITNNVTGIFNQVKNSIVQISARANPSEGISTRIESGFIYDTQGHIFTTNDVINGDNTALVAFADGNTYSAKVIGTDPSNDLAVLQITDNFSHENLVPLSMANSYGLQVGQQVIAIGHPFGLNYTMTTGIITQWVRLHFPATGYSISDVIQSNAPINPGSFGGPLLNRDGQVIGMNIAISSSTGEFSGIGFAIPSNIIISEVPRIIQTGTCSNCTR